jgi:hypothetical protein
MTQAILSKGPKGETMSDKKVGRTGGRPITPTQKMEAALSDPGTVNVADMPHDKGKSGVADKFREREERWRSEQAMHDQQAAHAQEHVERPAAEAGDTAERQAGEEGGGA